MSPTAFLNNIDNGSMLPEAKLSKWRKLKTLYSQVEEKSAFMSNIITLLQKQVVSNRQLHVRKLLCCQYNVAS